MSQSYHVGTMVLTISPRSVPAAYHRLADVVAVIGVSADQARAWCEQGNLPALLLDGSWWVREGDFADFVERCTWQIVSVPPLP